VTTLKQIVSAKSMDESLTDIDQKQKIFELEEELKRVKETNMNHMAL
jgi:hypothetical protein